MLGRQLWQLLGRRDWRGDVSAYLDDELTPRQRERVEARLARSEEMQAYLDDLRQMRTALRGFAAEPARAPFQITPEMLASHTAEPLRASNLERALRLSMTTAAIGVATFSAVLIFDAVDRPTVTFTTTAAGDVQAGSPTAQAATERAPRQGASAEADGTAVAVVSIASSESQQAQQSAWDAEAAEQVAQTEEPKPAEQSTAAAIRSEADEQAMQEQALQEQAQAEEQAEQAAWQQSTQEAQESAQAAHQQAAADPTRRAINAGNSSGEREEQEVNAEDVIAKQEEATEQATAPAEAAQEDEEPPAVEPADSAEATESAEPAESAGADEGIVQSAQEQAVADAGAASQSPTVTSSTRVVESEWPLPQRPQTSSVRLATDPSWEAPVQIALAIVAFGSLLTWILLTVMDRRRQT